jgi:uncharacterized protein (TIGR02217 family)
VADLETHLPQQVEIGALRRLRYSTEIVTTDGGAEVRNARWEDPLREFEISFPISARDNAIYTAVKALYDEALGGLYSFSFFDWTDGTTVDVRFDSPLPITGVTPDLDHIETMTIVEVRT